MSDELKIKVQLTGDALSRGLGLPRYETKHSAGMDLSFCGAPMTLKAGEIKLFKTGLSVEIPEGYEGQIRSRSGLSLKHGIAVLNAPGTIDSDYRGEIGVILKNFSEENFDVNTGDRIAQIVFSKHERAVWEQSEVLSSSVRGEGGFGHTGLQ